MSTVIFNSDILRQSTDGDMALETALLEEFEATIRRCLSALESDCDQQEWAERLHELKGAAASMGAEALVNSCRMGETLSLDRHHFLQALRHVASETLETIRQDITGSQATA